MNAVGLRWRRILNKNFDPVSRSSTGRLIDWSSARRARPLAWHVIHSGYMAR